MPSGLTQVVTRGRISFFPWLDSIPLCVCVQLCVIKDRVPSETCIAEAVSPWCERRRVHSHRPGWNSRLCAWAVVQLLLLSSRPLRYITALNAVSSSNAVVRIWETTFLNTEKVQETCSVVHFKKWSPYRALPMTGSFRTGSCSGRVRGRRMSVKA